MKVGKMNREQFSKDGKLQPWFSIHESPAIPALVEELKPGTLVTGTMDGSLAVGVIEEQDISDGAIFCLGRLFVYENISL